MGDFGSDLQCNLPPPILSTLRMLLSINGKVAWQGRRNRHRGAGRHGTWAAAGALQDGAQAVPGGCTRVLCCAVPWSDGGARAPLLHPVFALPLKALWGIVELSGLRAHMCVNEICNLGPCGTARKIATALPSASGPESAARGRLFPCPDVRPRLSQSLPVPPLSLWERCARQRLGPRGERAVSQGTCKFSKGVVLCVVTEK